MNNVRYDMEEEKFMKKQRYFNSLTAYQQGQYKYMEQGLNELKHLRNEVLKIEIKGRVETAHKMKGTKVGIESILCGANDLIGGELLEEFNGILEAELIEYKAQVKYLKDLVPKNRDIDYELRWDRYVHGGK